MFLMKQNKGFNRSIYINFSVWIHFYLHSSYFPSFSFYLHPHFYSVFLSHFQEFGLDLCEPQSHVEALHLCSITVWLASISFRSRVNKKNLRKTTIYTSHFDVIFILFLTPYLTCLCFVFHFILTTVIHPLE